MKYIGMGLGFIGVAGIAYSSADAAMIASICIVGCVMHMSD